MVRRAPSRSDGQGIDDKHPADDKIAKPRKVNGVRAMSVGQRFGRHVRSCRRARGQTQETLAEVSSLSADTIRRLEHGSFSPSLETLCKLCVGFEIQLSTLFDSFELGERDGPRELANALDFLTPEEAMVLLQFVIMFRRRLHDDQK